ncbi:hypothetical protein Tco_0904426 [Tanacetum coccineum]
MSASGHDALADITAKADPGKFYPKDSLSKQQDATQSTGDGLHSDNDDDDEIKLEDLTELVKDKDVEALDLDSPKDDQPIKVSSEEEADIYADTHVETKDTSSQKLKLEKDKAATKATSLTAQPSFTNVQQLTELLVNALKLELTQLITNHDLNASILTELNELPSKVKEINRALGDLKQYMEKLEIKVAALENIKLNILAGLLVLPQHVSLINARITKLKVLDALPSPLNKVVKALDRENVQDKGKKAMSYEEVVEEESHSYFDAEIRLIEEMENQKGIKQAVKADVAMFKIKKGKKYLIDILGQNVVDKVYKDKAATVLNEPTLGMIIFNSKHRQDFISIDDFEELNKDMLYNVQEIFFRLHQRPLINDLARIFSSFLVAEVDKRNLNLNKQMRLIKQPSLVHNAKLNDAALLLEAKTKCFTSRRFTRSD